MKAACRKYPNFEKLAAPLKETISLDTQDQEEILYNKAKCPFYNLVATANFLFVRRITFSLHSSNVTTANYATNYNMDLTYFSHSFSVTFTLLTECYMFFPISQSITQGLMRTTN